jgi:hypothetical protein
MICFPMDLDCELPKSNDSGNDAKVFLFGLQTRPLLDVELHIPAQVSHMRTASEGATPRERSVWASALLVMEADYLNSSGSWMLRLDQCPQGLERGNYSIGPVKPSTCRHGVRVRTNEQPGAFAGALPPEYVVDFVCPWMQTRVLNPALKPLPSRKIGWRSGRSVNASIHSTADLRQLAQIRQ